MKVSPKAEDLIAEARAVDARFLDAFNRGDVDGLTSTYWNSPETELYPPGEMVVKGVENIRSCFAKMIRETPDARLQMLETNYHAEGVTVVSTGRWKMVVPTPDGKLGSVEGRYTETLARRDGKMVIIVDHASVPLPPPADSGTGKGKHAKPRAKERKA